MTSKRQPPLSLPATLLILATRAKLLDGKPVPWELVAEETRHSKRTVLAVWQWFKDLEWEQAKELVGDSDEILRLRPDYLERKLGEAQKTGPGTFPWESLLTREMDKGFGFMGQLIATELDKWTSRVYRSFGCYDIGLKLLRDTLCAGLGQRFEDWLGEEIRSVESSMERRKSLQDQILVNAKSGCQSPGSIELVDNNFVLAGYHFLARGDEAWLEDDRFQVLQLFGEGSPCRQLECPRCTYQIFLQQWDTREFVCPEHGVPLVIPAPYPLPKPPVNHTDLYEESLIAIGSSVVPIVPIEYIALEHPSKKALSLRIPKMLPFSELVIAVGKTTSIRKLRHLVKDFLRASPLRVEVCRNEEDLQRSYAKLLESLRSTPTTDVGHSESGDS